MTRETGHRSRRLTSRWPRDGWKDARRAICCSSVDVTRRQFAVLAGGALASVVGSACRGTEALEHNDGRIAARPRTGTKTSAAGSHPLRLGDGRDGILQMPAAIPTGPLPLLVLLHGAGGSAAGVLRRLGPAPGDAGVAVLAPESRDTTWDAIGGVYGPDVVFLNRALERVFASVDVDPERLTLGGFSDGATYAVGLGLINGDLFRRVAALSPGFIVDGSPHGKPRFFISHGTADTILPIERCGRVVAAVLKRRGYDVTFREFDGGHEVPPAIAAEAMRWIAGSRPSAEHRVEAPRAGARG